MTVAITKYTSNYKNPAEEPQFQVPQLIPKLCSDRER